METVRVLLLGGVFVWGLRIKKNKADAIICIYLERVKGVDISKARKELLPSKVEKSIKDNGSGVYTVNTSHKLQVKDRTVVTVLTMEMD